MSTEEHPTVPSDPIAPGGARGRADAGWGAPLTPSAEVETPTQVEIRPHWSARKVIGAVILAALIVSGGTAAAIAATAPSSSSSQPKTPSTGSYPGSGNTRSSGGYNSRTGHSSGAWALGNALHGDFVVQTNTGGYATERLQNGRVDRVSSTSISLTSADGYAGTYTITTATLINRGETRISEVRRGDMVTVIAALSGNTATAISLTDPARQPAGGRAPTTSIAPTPEPGGPDGMQPNNGPNG